MPNPPPAAIRVRIPTAPPSSSETGSAPRNDNVVSYCFPKEWPADREQRARYIVRIR